MLWITLWHLIVFVGLTLLEIGFVVVKINRNVDWAWSLVFLWIWIAFVLVFFYTVRYLVVDEQATNTTLKRGHATANLISLLLLFTFAVLASIQLDVRFSEWSIIFIPFWALLAIEMVLTPTFDILYNRSQAGAASPGSLSISSAAARRNWSFIKCCVGIYQEEQEAIEDDDDDEEDSTTTTVAAAAASSTEKRNPSIFPPAEWNVRQPRGYEKRWSYIIKWELLYLCAAAFTILLAVRVHNWNLVFIPVWVALFVWTCSLLRDFLVKFSVRRGQSSLWLTHRTWLELTLEFLFYLGVVVWVPLLLNYLIHLRDRHVYDEWVWYDENEEDHRLGSILDPTTVFAPLIIALLLIFFASYFVYFFRDRRSSSSSSATAAAARSSSLNAVASLVQNKYNILRSASMSGGGRSDAVPLSQRRELI